VIDAEAGGRACQRPVSLDAGHSGGGSADCVSAPRPFRNDVAAAGVRAVVACGRARRAERSAAAAGCGVAAPGEHLRDPSSAGAAAGGVDRGGDRGFGAARPRPRIRPGRDPDPGLPCGGGPARLRARPAEGRGSVRADGRRAALGGCARCAGVPQAGRAAGALHPPRSSPRAQQVCFRDAPGAARVAAFRRWATVSLRSPSCAWRPR
jgi:hypothetical protein